MLVWRSLDRQMGASMRSAEQIYGIIVLATFVIFSLVLAWESRGYRRPAPPASQAGAGDPH